MKKLIFLLLLVSCEKEPLTQECKECTFKTGEVVVLCGEELAKSERNPDAVCIKRECKN